MKRKKHKPLFIIFLALLFALPAASEGKKASGGEKEENKIPDPDSKEFLVYVMNKIDDQHRGNKSYGVWEMEVKTKHWHRTLEMESWSLGQDYTLMHVLSPKKEKGNATLKAKNDLFTYLAKSEKTIKITSGMMGGSWMGSHFTNDDIVRESRLSDDFDIKKNADGKAGDVSTYRFTLTPKPDAPVVWGKITVTVRQSDLQPLTQVYYGEDGEKVRMQTFSDHQEIDGRTMPMTMVMKPLDGSGEYTKVKIKKIDFDIKLDKKFFTLQKLKSL
ncbi:MAG: outer membrane lipoprotein-sorting protein [Pseudomonadota bacterium]